MDNRDYLDIIIKGYINNKENLVNYFYRIYKQKELEHYDIDEFFTGCDKVLGLFKQDIFSKKEERKRELYKLLELAKKEKRLKDVDRFKNDINDEKPNYIGGMEFYSNMIYVTNGSYRGHLRYHEILGIENSLNLAKLKVIKENENKDLKQTHKDVKIYDLFDYILENDNLTNTEIYNIIKVKTNLEPIRLELLICDIQSYLFTNDNDNYMNYNDTNLYLHKYAPLYSIWELLKKLLVNSSQEKNINNPFKNPPHDYFIILEMLATNEVEVLSTNEFKYNGKKYLHGNELNKVINTDKGFKPHKKFTQYLNNFRAKGGYKYILDTKHDITKEPDYKKIKRLRDFKEYAESNNLNIVNEDFKNAFNNI